MKQFLFLIMHHIYYKHRDDLLKKYESKVPTHASQIDMAIRDGSTLSEIKFFFYYRTKIFSLSFPLTFFFFCSTLLETCTPADLPLTAAVEQCSLEVVSLFLQKGANPDSGNPPPLLVATRGVAFFAFNFNNPSPTHHNILEKTNNFLFFFLSQKTSWVE